MHSEKIAEITPEGLNKTFFTTGGADAIENAIKIARLYTGKQKIITRYRSYHGATYGAISAGGHPRKHPVSKDSMPELSMLKIRTATVALGEKNLKVVKNLCGSCRTSHSI